MACHKNHKRSNFYMDGRIGNYDERAYYAGAKMAEITTRLRV